MIQRYFRMFPPLLIAVSLAACPSLSSLRGPSRDFVAAANALAQAESDYFNEIQAATDSAYRLQAAEDYVGQNGSFKHIADEFGKHDDFSKAKALRMAAMQQLVNYAQQIQAIITGSSTTWIADDARSATTNIGKLVKDIGDNADAQLLTKNSGLIKTAVTDLGRAIINSESANELQTLAQDARAPIRQIAKMVKWDNDNIEADQFANGLKLDQTHALKDILHWIYLDPKVNAAERFGSIQIATNWKQSLVTKSRTIQSALAKLEAANEAMAKKENTSLDALSRQIYALAKQAIATPSPETAIPAK